MIIFDKRLMDIITKNNITTDDMLWTSFMLFPIKIMSEESILSRIKWSILILLGNRFLSWYFRKEVPSKSGIYYNDKTKEWVTHIIDTDLGEK